jgi:hypothetical protein
LSSLAVSVIVAGLIAGSGFIGLFLQKHLAEQYTTERSRDMIGGGAGLLTLLLAAEERAGGAALVAGGDRDSFQLGLVVHYDPLPVAGWGNSAHRARRGQATIWRRSKPSAGLHCAPR